MLPWALAPLLLTATCFSSALGQSSDYPLCDSGFEDLVGNGGCSDINNTEECGWDGGDCCECDCEDGTWECGALGYDCRNPDSTCYGGPTTDDFYDSSDDFYDFTDDFYGDGGYPLCDGSPSLIGSGACLDSNNNEDCGWDGGDCCECDCVSASSVCGSLGYDCQDPGSACYGDFTAGDDFYGSADDSLNDDSPNDYPLCDGYVSLIASGACTVENNNAECGWDGGDCCECDCVSDYMDYCGSQGYDCQDTSSDCYEGEGFVNDADGDSGDTTDFAEDSENFSAGLITVCVVAGVILLVLTCVLCRADSFVTCTCCCLSERAAAGKASRASPPRDAAPLSPPPPYGSSPRGTSAVGAEYAVAEAPSASSQPPGPAHPVSPPPAYDDAPSAPVPSSAPHATMGAPRAPTAPPAP